MIIKSVGFIFFIRYFLFLILLYFFSKIYQNKKRVETFKVKSKQNSVKLTPNDSMFFKEKITPSFQYNKLDSKFDAFFTVNFKSNLAQFLNLHRQNRMKSSFNKMSNLQTYLHGIVLYIFGVNNFSNKPYLSDRYIYNLGVFYYQFGVFFQKRNIFFLNVFSQ